MCTGLECCIEAPKVFSFAADGDYKGRYIDRYLKNSVSKSIVHVIKHANFHLYRVHSDGVI